MDNKTPGHHSTRSGIVCAIGVIVLLLGTATDSAVAMLALAAMGLALILVGCLPGSQRKIALIVTAATAIATLSAFVASKL
jgi:uncharacterized membrane protein YhaH (DUF805 family)